MQYEVQVRDGAKCGGAYVKVRSNLLSVRPAEQHPPYYAVHNIYTLPALLTWPMHQRFTEQTRGKQCAIPIT